MNARRAGTAVAATLLVAVLAVGCRAGDAATPPPPGASTSDPLGGIDATLDRIERDLDTDATTG